MALCALAALPEAAQAQAKSTQATTKQLKAKKSDLGELRQRIDQLKKDMNAAESAREEAADQLRDQERSISELRRELHELARQREAVQKRIAELDKETRQAESRLDGNRAQIERLLTQHYITGIPGPARIFLSGQNPNQIGRDFFYLSQIGQARQQLAQQTSDIISEKTALASRAESEAAELAAVEAKQRQQQEKMLGQRAERKKTLSRISQKLKSQRKEINTLTRNEARLSRLVDQLNKLIAARAKAAKDRREKAAKAAQAAKAAKAAKAAQARQQKSGTTPAPTTVDAPEDTEAVDDGRAAYPSLARLKGRLPTPAEGRLAQRYGAKLDGGVRSKGVFYQTADDAPIRAIAAGQVVFVDWMRGFGNLLVIDHDNGFLSIYGYTEAVLKQVGDEVRSGETIATAGNTGGQAETGLYFELRRQGEPLDPGHWLKR